MENSCCFFRNTNCRFFPCHVGVDREKFNCLFCYCPLYLLGKNCGGNYSYLENGIKDCTNCLFPHIPENYEKINKRFKDITSLILKTDID